MQESPNNLNNTNYQHSTFKNADNKDILDREDSLGRVGSKESAASYFIMTQAKSKIEREGIISEEYAERTYHDVERVVHKAIEQIEGHMPEDLPPAPSIKKLLDEKRREQRKRLKERPQSDEPDGTEQGKLFE